MPLAQFSSYGPEPPLDEGEYLACASCGTTYTAAEIDENWDEMWVADLDRAQCLSCAEEHPANSGTPVKGFVRRSGRKAREALTDRWGAAGKRFVAVPTALLDFAPLLGIDAYGLLVLIAIERHRVGADAKAFPSVGRLARLAGCSTRTVQSRLAQLEASSLLRRRGRVRSDGGQTSNLYELDGLYARVARLAAEREGETQKLRLRARRQRGPGAWSAPQERD